LRQDPPRPALLLAQAWFRFDEQDKPQLSPARLDIWRPDAEGVWGFSRLEDPESNVFHKAMPWKGGILTIGAERAALKHWLRVDGAWKARTLWQRSWGGQFDRLRDMELGDVDADGQDDIVVASHDYGVVAVVGVQGEEVAVTELGRRPGTFVHEVELGDSDGDGALEIFFTPSERNQIHYSQSGAIGCYHWGGADYKIAWLDSLLDTHAKEILAADLDGDGKDEVYALVEAVLAEDKSIERPVQLRRYRHGAQGFEGETLLSLPAARARFLVAADFDRDGQLELVAATCKSGLFLIEMPAAAGAAWRAERFEARSSGYEHAILAADLEGDGQVELYVAADDQRELRRYDFDAQSGGFQRSVLGRLEGEARASLVWNMAAMTR